jgi:predicted RNase H-related nuclease YkuK (DUF458 family)
MNNSDLTNKKWKTPKNPKIFSTEEVFSCIQETLLENELVDISIGTDSQHVGKGFRFVTVVCAYRPGKGGIFFYNQENVEVTKYPIGNQKMRMFDEATKSIDLAYKLEEDIGFKPCIHIDASPEKNGEFTSAFVEQIKGYVIASGFECLTKPEAYAASFIADKYSKRKSKRKQRNMSVSKSSY